MAKGLYTQGMCILLREPVSVQAIQERFKSFSLLGTHESMEDDDAPVTLVYDYRGDVNGHLLVTPAKVVWPDDMGDPDESPERFVAWSLGQYGPLAYPGCLQRAGEQAWGWEEAREEVRQHRAHLRLLISYVLGLDEATEDDEDVPLVPDDYDPLDELDFLTRAATAVLEMPEAICYFNPGGEVLRDENGLRRGLNHAWSHQLPPLDMWTNIRLFRASEDWALMDTVGNGQLDLPDLEAIYPTDRYPPSEVEGFLRSASLYLLQSEEEVEEGDTADGPGEVQWMAMECPDALSDPPRPTLRWVPQDGSVPPDALLDRGSVPDWEEEEWSEEGDEFDSSSGLDEDIDD